MFLRVSLTRHERGFGDGLQASRSGSHLKKVDTVRTDLLIRRLHQALTKSYQTEPDEKVTGSGGFMEQFAGHMKEVGQIMPNSARVSQSKIEYGVWQSGPWCSQGNNY